MWPCLLLLADDLDCQWLDITDVPAGTYKLHVTINKGGEYCSKLLVPDLQALPFILMRAASGQARCLSAPSRTTLQSSMLTSPRLSDASLTGARSCVGLVGCLFHGFVARGSCFAG